MINILMIGEILSLKETNHLAKYIAQIKKEQQIDLIILNGNKVSQDKNFIKNLKQFEEIGVDLIYSRTSFSGFKESKIKTISPSNNLEGLLDFIEIEVKDKKIKFMSLVGDKFSNEFINCFDYVEKNEHEIKKQPVILLLDSTMTSLKKGFPLFAKDYFIGVFGTGKLSQSKDDEILANKMAFISDVGYCGSDIYLINDINISGDEYFFSSVLYNYNDNLKPIEIKKYYIVGNKDD